jgi:hypothetical protein
LSVSQPILDKLTDALDRTLDDDNVHTRLLDLAGNLPSKAKRGQQPLAALMKGEITWTPIIKAANVLAE